MRYPHASMNPAPQGPRTAGNGPSPYFSSALGLFGGLILWQLANAVLLPQLLQGHLGAPAGQDGSYTKEQLEAAMQALAATPTGPLAIVLPGQLVFVLIACVLGFLSREAFLDRLALRKPAVGFIPIVLVLVGMVGMQLGMSALQDTFGLTSEYFDFLRQLLVDAERAPAASLVILLALLPAFCQELFFRGLVQSRLVAVWPAGAAVLLTATVWSLVHVDASRVLAALPIGIYLGIVAWKSASTWVAMLAAAVNYLTMLFLAPHMSTVGAGGFVLVCVLLGAGVMGIFALIRSQAAQAAEKRVLETLK